MVIGKIKQVTYSCRRAEGFLAVFSTDYSIICIAEEDIQEELKEEKEK